MSDSSERWRERQGNTSRHSSVKDRWPPSNKENKTTSNSAQKSSRTAAEVYHQKPPSGSSSTTTGYNTRSKTGQTSSSSSANTNNTTSRHSVPTSRASEHHMTGRNTGGSKMAPSTETPGSSASQSGEGSGVDSEKKTNASSDPKTIPPSKTIIVGESPSHSQLKAAFNLTGAINSNTKRNGRKPGDSSSATCSSVYSGKGSVSRITIKSKRTPSPEHCIPSNPLPSKEPSIQQNPPASPSQRNLLPDLPVNRLKLTHQASGSSQANAHNIKHLPESPTSPPYDSGGDTLTLSTLDDTSTNSAGIGGSPVTCSSGVKGQTDPNSREAPAKIIMSGHPSYEASRFKTPPENNLRQLRDWKHSTSSESTSSTSSDKMVTPGGSLKFSESGQNIFSRSHGNTAFTEEQLTGQKEKDWDDSLREELAGDHLLGHSTYDEASGHVSLDEEDPPPNHITSGESNEPHVNVTHDMLHDHVTYNKEMELHDHGHVTYDGGTMLSTNVSMKGKSTNQGGHHGNKDESKDERDDEVVKEKGAGASQLTHTRTRGIQSGESGASRMLCPGRSFEMDQQGKPVTGPQRQTHQFDDNGATPHQDLSVEQLQANLFQKEAEINALKANGEEMKKTIATLRKMMKQDHKTGRKGLRSEDVDDYTDDAVQLTIQLSDLEAKLLEKSNYIAQLEQEVGGASHADVKVKQLEEEKVFLVERVHQLEEQVSKSSQTSHRERVEGALKLSNQSDRSSSSAGYNHQRHIMDQLSEIPKLEKEMDSLQSQLKHAESFREDAQKYEQQVVQQMEEFSLLEQEHETLQNEMEMQASQLASVEGQLEQTIQENEELRSKLKQSSSQSMIQTAEGESSAPDASVSEIVAVLTAKVDELQNKLKHKDKMMQRLKDHIAKMTVPSSVPEGSVDDPQQAGVNRTAPQLHSSGSEGDGTPNDMQTAVLVQGSAHAEGERKHGKNKEQEIEGSPRLIAKVAALRVDVKEKDVKIANLTRQLQSLTQISEELAKIRKHSRKQSKVIADLKGQLEQHEKADTNLSTALAENEYLKSQQTNYDSTIRHLQAKNAQLSQQVETLTKRGQDYAIAKYKESEDRCQQLEKIVTELQATMETLREEKEGFVKKVKEMAAFEELKNHLEQVVLSQKAVIANGKQALQDSKAKATELAQEKLGLENQLFRIMKEKEELQSEVEVQKFAASTFEEDFKSERRDRAEAHSKIANIETQCQQQVEAVNKMLQDADREKETLRGTLKETETRYQGQISALRNQADSMRERIANLEDEVQSRTQQGKQYKKMIESYKDELTVSKEQAAEHKKQIELFAIEADDRKRTCEGLRREIENLNARERHLVATQGGSSSSSRGMVPVGELQKERTRREQLEKTCQNLEGMYDQMQIKVAMLTSENDQYKKQLGVSQRDQHQPPPSSSSKASGSGGGGAYNPNIQRGGLITAGGQERFGQTHPGLPNQPPMASPRRQQPFKSPSVDNQHFLNSRGHVEQHQLRSSPRNFDSNTQASRSNDQSQRFQPHGMQSSSNVPHAGGQQLSSGGFNREGRPHTDVMMSLQSNSGFNAQGVRQSRDDFHMHAAGSSGSSHSPGGVYGGNNQHFQYDGSRVVYDDGHQGNMQGGGGRGNVPVPAGGQYAPQSEHAQYYHNLHVPGRQPMPQQVKPDIRVTGTTGGTYDAGRYSEDAEKDSPPGSLAYRPEGTGSSGPSSLNPQMLESYKNLHQGQEHLHAQFPRRSSHQYDLPGRGGDVHGGGLQGMTAGAREPHVSSHDQQRIQQLNRQDLSHQHLQQLLHKHQFQQHHAGRVQGGNRAAGSPVRGSSSPSFFPSSSPHQPQTQGAVGHHHHPPLLQHSNTADLSLRVRQQQHHQQEAGLNHRTGNAARSSSGVNAPHSQSSQQTPKRPTQESSGLSESSQSQLPSALRNQSQNVYSPPHTQHATSSNATPGRGERASKVPEQDGSSNLDNSQSSIYLPANKLESGIDGDIEQAATIVKKQVGGRESLEGEGGDLAPFDPNLVCPTCKRQFRIGEIQKYRKHAASCIKE